jgi:hypothetical protein
LGLIPLSRIYPQGILCTDIHIYAYNANYYA